MSKKGWFDEPTRHSLSAKGIKTAKEQSKMFSRGRKVDDPEVKRMISELNDIVSDYGKFEVDESDIEIGEEDCLGVEIVDVNYICDGEKHPVFQITLGNEIITQDYGKNYMKCAPDEDKDVAIVTKSYKLLDSPHRPNEFNSKDESEDIAEEMRQDINDYLEKDMDLEEVRWTK